MLSAEPVIQVFHGRGIAERGMLSCPVVPQGDFLSMETPERVRGVKRFDVIEQISLRFVLRTIASAMHPLILQAVEGFKVPGSN